MRETNLKEARQKLRVLIDEVAEGQEIVLTRRGSPVARLMPVESEPPGPLPSLASFRASIQVRGRPLSEEVAAGREEERY